MRERIKEKRKASALSQQQLSELLGLSFMTIRRWEAGEVSPRVDELKNLASTLNTSVSYLMGLDDNPAPSTLSDAATQKKESYTNEDRGMSTYTFSDGERAEFPATERGYALFEKLMAQKKAALQTAAGSDHKEERVS